MSPGGGDWPSSSTGAGDADVGVIEPASSSPSSFSSPSSGDPSSPPSPETIESKG